MMSKNLFHTKSNVSANVYFSRLITINFKGDATILNLVVKIIFLNATNPVKCVVLNS